MHASSSLQGLLCGYGELFMPYQAILRDPSLFIDWSEHGSNRPTETRSHSILGSGCETRATLAVRTHYGTSCDRRDATDGICNPFIKIHWASSYLSGTLLAGAYAQRFPRSQCSFAVVRARRSPAGVRWAKSCCDGLRRVFWTLHQLR